MRRPGHAALDALAAVLIVICGAGCGGGSVAAGRREAPAPAAGPAAVATPRVTGYRWLVNTSGPPPSPAAENRAAGSTAWHLSTGRFPLGGIASGDVVGFVSRPAVSAGQSEAIFVNAVGYRWARIRIFRMGWYHGRGGREVLRTGRLSLRRQPPCLHNLSSGVTVCRWHATLRFRIPPALPGGVYIAKLIVAGGARDCLFVVRSQAPVPLLVMLPTATYQAYNTWGGDSLYPGGALRRGAHGSTQGQAVSFARPYDSLTGAGQFLHRDVALVRFLERYGYPAAYTTDESVDAEPRQLRSRRALIVPGHSEYWSARQLHGFVAARRAGTSLLFFSSDLIAEPVRYLRSGHGASRWTPTIAALGTLAAGPGAVARAQRFRLRSAGLTGSAYLGCITPRLPVPGSPVYDYYPWHPNRALAPRWLFARTGLTANSSLPGIVGYELDARIATSPRDARVIGSGVARCPSSGRLAGETPLQTGGDVAQTTLSTARSGAVVFTSGTLGWELGLQPIPGASPDSPTAPEPALVRMTRNLLGHVLGRSAR